jgi:hypothetical protein
VFEEEFRQMPVEPPAGHAGQLPFFSLHRDAVAGGRDARGRGVGETRLDSDPICLTVKSLGTASDLMRGDRTGYARGSFATSTLITHGGSDVTVFVTVHSCLADVLTASASAGGRLASKATSSFIFVRRLGGCGAL